MPSQGYQYAPTGPQGLSGYHGSLGLPRSPMPQGYQTYGGWAPQGYPVNQGPPRSAGVPLQGFPPQMQGPGVQFGGRPQQSFAPAAQAYPPQQWPTRGTMTPAGQPAAPAAAASTTSSPAAQSLAGGVDKLCSDEDISRAFANTLQMIAPEVLPSLRPDASGCLRVASPFCGGFVEAGPIHEFLKTSVLSIPQIQRIHVDVHDIQHTADSSIESLGPQTTITYEARNLDLLKEKMPPVCLTLGVHPQITGSGWEQIINNVIASSDISVFFMFAQVESQTLADICRRAGYACSIRQNPHGRAQLVPRGVPPDDMKRYNWVGIVKKL
uniref:Uncharacterized protein n=1 Tax=Eutreptiella gymnastica TaxID=73025 RepID=A0A7S4FSG4_9EUGL